MRPIRYRTGNARLMLRILAWVLLAPVYLARTVYRVTRRLHGGWILATRDALECRSCGNPIPLTGRFRCDWCHFSFEGFAFRPCPNCGALPPFLDCQVCGVSIKNPMVLGSGG